MIFTAISLLSEVTGRRFVWEVALEDVATGRLATTQREVTAVDELP